MARLMPRRPRLDKPGLFVTGTDTGVGKTLVTCAIAWHLRQHAILRMDSGGRGSGDVGRRNRVAVCKPVATGCRRDREGLISEDAEALAHFADCREPLDVINPVRYRQPVAPAVAAQQTDAAIDGRAIVRSLERLGAGHDVILVEGIGGLLVPLDNHDPECTVIDLIKDIGFPVLVVTRAGLGTLNHTAMTVRLLRGAGLAVAGLVVNGFIADSSSAAEREADASMATNRSWLERMNGLRVLATVPACGATAVAPQAGHLPPAILDAVGVTYWPQVLAPAS